MIGTHEAPIKVYADPSVYGRAFDRGFAEPSQQFFDEVRQGRFELVISSLIEEEMNLAADNALALFYEFFDSARCIASSTEVVNLCDAYINAGIITPEAAYHAAHVAMATISGCALLVSWNYKHIVHFDKIPKYNEVNALHERQQIAIYQPSAVILYDVV
jgi:hypothetical protein